MSFLLKLFFNFFCFLRPFWALSTIFGLCSVLKDDLSKLFSVFVTMGLSEQKIDQVINYIDWNVNPKTSDLLFSTTIASPIPMLLWALHLYTPQSVWLTWMMIKRDFERIWWFRVGSCYELLLWHEIQNLKKSLFPGKIIAVSWLQAPNFFHLGHYSWSYWTWKTWKWGYESSSMPINILKRDPGWIGLIPLWYQGRFPSCQLCSSLTRCCPLGISHWTPTLRILIGSPLTAHVGILFQALGCQYILITFKIIR